MLVHTVLFWLKDELEEAQRSSFLQGLESLKGIESVEAVYIGTPAETTERPVIDTSYDYCLTVLLPDMAAHDAYQVDPLHSAFLEQFNTCWKAVKIYDAD
ncbi:MAG: Dabb family protein [Coraliomargaritaceae bacterium]